MFVKALIVLFLIVIVYNLGAAMVYMYQDGSNSKRTVRALTLRIGLSVSLFIVLLLAYATGLIQPHGIHPG